MRPKENLPWMFVLVFVAGCLCFQSLGDDPLSVVDPNGKPERVADGFKFTEGPVWSPSGSVYFSDIPNQRIHQWSKKKGLSTVREESGGANGLYFDSKGNLVACEGVARRLTSMDDQGRIQVLASEYAGARLNSPNDLWIDPKGGIYFTDPRYGNQDDLEQDGMHVYYLKPEGAELIRVIDDMKRPNGLVGTPDGKKLYVADHGGDKTYVYDIETDGTLQNRILFAEQGSDGMTMDERGNIYLTSQAVDVYSPEGKKITTIPTPETPANVCFGGKRGKTLFVTARSSLYAVEMKVRGIQWKE